MSDNQKLNEDKLTENVVLDEQQISRRDLQQKMMATQKGTKIVEVEPNKFKTMTRLQG